MKTKRLVLHLYPAHASDVAALMLGLKTNIPEFIRSHGLVYNPARYYTFEVTAKDGGAVSVKVLEGPHP
jgi:hypothetical protein